MKRLGLTLIAIILLMGKARAQVLEITLTDSPDVWKGRSYLLHVQEHTTSGYNSGGDGAMRSYAKAHAQGDYLLFVQDGKLYRVDTPAELAPLAALQQPLEHLSSLQSSLAANMKPLSATQSQLGTAMRSTTSYREMGRIGHEQGIIGQRQGELGRQQGVIGRQQGLLSRALNQGVQQAIDRSLARNTCVLIGQAEPQTAHS